MQTKKLFAVAKVLFIQEVLRAEMASSNVPKWFHVVL